MDTPGNQLEKFLGGWLRSVSNAVTSSFTRQLEASGFSIAEWAVLRAIESEPATAPSDVARRTGLSRGAVSKLVDRAIDKGLVERFESHADRRYRELKLTRKARGLVPRLTAIAAENDDQYFTCLTTAQRDTLVRLLKKVAEAHEITGVPTK